MQSDKSLYSTDLESASSREAEVLCTHCGLIVPKGLVRSSSKLYPGTPVNQFCCTACETVYEILSQNNLMHYYALRERYSTALSSPPKGKKSFNYFDDEGFQSSHVRKMEEGEERSVVELYVEGLHCAACVWLLEKSPEILSGLLTVRIDYSKSLARVEFTPTKTPLSRIALLFQSLGYTPHPYRSIARRDLRRLEERRLLGKMGIAFIGAGNSMMLAICLYAGLFTGIAAEYADLFRWFSLILTTPVVFYSASAFYRGAFAALRMGKLAFDLPITLGLLAGYLFSVVNTVRGQGEVYFDTVCVLVFFLLVSRWLQFRARKLSQEASEFLLSFLPTTVRVVRGEEAVEIPLEQLSNGLEVEVLAHEIIPVDGTVSSGQGWIDASLLTGESRPVSVSPGSKIHAGTQNLSSPLRVIAEASGEETRLGRFLSVVDETLSRKAPVLQLVDRIAPIFTVVILLFSVVALVLGVFIGVEEGLSRAVALLVVCCPCALAMATPLALAVNIGRAARKGIYIKGGDVVERAATIKKIVFDKTGTLTQGEFTVLSWNGEDTETLRQQVAALESCSVHPIARALSLTGFGRSTDTSDLAVEAVDEQLGRGISGKVAGERIVLGTAAYLEYSGVTIPAEMLSEKEAAAHRGETPVFVSRNGECVAVIGLGDPIREDAGAVLETLRKAGYETTLLSGDEETVVTAVGGRLGFSPSQVHGGVSPEQKLQYVQNLKYSLMIGDGVNDAGALASATVGMAAHGGAEGSLVVSDVFLTRSELRLVPEFLHGAKLTMRIIRRNLFFSLLYNIIGGGLAIFGYLSPLGAAVLMPLSSVTVFLSSMMNQSFTERR